MLGVLCRALNHGWQIHGYTGTGIFLNLKGDFVLFITWTGELQYRGSRSAAGLKLIAAC